jgi:predicted RND superfamily exporter protein
MSQSSTKVSQFANKYIGFAQKFRFLLLTLAIILAVSCLYYTKDNLKLNKNLSALLPDNTPSVMALAESNQRFGSTDRFMIGIKSSDPVLIAQMQDTIKQYIDKNWKDISISSQVANDNSFFEEHALLYLPSEHLERIRDNLITVKRKMGSAGPLTVNLLEDEEIEEEEEELVWFDASIPQELGLPDEAASTFSKFLKADSTKEETKKEDFDSKANIPDAYKTRLIGQSSRDSSFNGVVIAKMIEPSTNLNFSEIVLARSGELVNELNARKYSTDILFSVEGTYEGLKDVEDMANDGIVSTSVSIFLILFLLFYFFKSFKAAIILVAQILFACILMLCFTAAVYGQLNLFTLFVAAIILGMGIDYSIHYIGTAQREYTETGDLRKALVNTTIHLIRPMILAALTTVAGLLTLLIADFKGFYEFGVIASAGILFSVGTALLGLPVLVMIIGGLPKNKNRSFFPKSWSDSKVESFISKGGKFVLISALLLSPFILNAEFEHNMRNLRADKKQSKKGSGIHTGAALSSNRKSSQPVAVFGDSQEELKALHDTLVHRRNIDKDSYLRSFLTLYSFVPDEDDQDDRMDIIEEIDELIQSKAFDKITDKEQKELVNQLREMVDVETFTAEDIPEWALDLLKEKDGTYGRIGFIYGSFESWNAKDVARFQDKYGHWKFEGDKLRAFSSSFIFSDVIRAVKEDSSKMAVLITIVILLTLSLSLRNFKAVIVCTASLGLGVILTMEFMGILNLVMNIGKVGVFNVIVIPTLIGVGIDSTIHLLSSYQQESQTLRRLMDTTGRMVIASSLTTAAGFLGVLFVSHKGMRTIGELAVLGIFCTLVAALLMTPWLCKVLLKKNESQS